MPALKSSATPVADVPWPTDAFLPGAFALDFGGKQAGAAASGLVDGTGYLGGVLAGTVMARLAVAFGWGGVFVTLAVVSALAAVGAGYLWVLNARAAAAAPPG